MKRKVLIVGIIVLLAVGGWFVLRPPKEFDASLWKNSATSPSDRVRMADDLVDGQKLNGLTREEAVALLGEPAGTEYSKDALVFFVAPQTAFWNIDSWCLLWSLVPMDEPRLLGLSPTSF